MIKHLVAPLVFTSLILTGCQSPQGKFTPEQVAAMQSYGFTESAGDWSLGLSDAILFAKNDYKLLPESQQQIQTMAAKLASTGLTHARMDGHTDNYGEDSYNEGLSLITGECRGRCMGYGWTNSTQQSHHTGFRKKISHSQ